MTLLLVREMLESAKENNSCGETHGQRRACVQKKKGTWAALNELAPFSRVQVGICFDREALGVHQESM